MTRYGAQFGPDITFLGVPAVDVADTAALAAADVVVVGAPFDGGTSHRPGTRFGPTAIRQTDYLPQDGSRPHLALRVDALQDVTVVDMGDVEMPPGEIERALHALEDAVYAVASAGAIPLVLGGDHSIALPDATGVARHLGRATVRQLLMALHPKLHARRALAPVHDVLDADAVVREDHFAYSASSVSGVSPSWPTATSRSASCSGARTSSSACRA